jgi:hypothetical protein
MILLHACCLAVCLAQPPGETNPTLPEGVHALNAHVLDVRETGLLVEIGARLGGGIPLLIKMTEKSRFSVWEPTTDKTDEGVRAMRRPIRPQELRKRQKVSLIVASDGKEVLLLTCVASGVGSPQVEAKGEEKAGPKSNTEAMLKAVAALGGKARAIPSFPKGKAPERWHIDLSGTKIKDGDLIPCRRFTEMSSLDLSFTGIGNKGLEHLRGHPNLSDLDLIGTRVTDEAVPALKQLKRLDRLGVALTRITDKGVDELHEAFPTLSLCRIASGKKGHFRIRENFRSGKLQRKELMIGDTLFAVAFPAAPAEAPEGFDWRRLATTYYHRAGPVGQVMARFEWFPSAPDKNTHPSDAHLPASLIGLSAGARLLPDQALVGLWSEPAVGVIRLNAGTHACYGRPFQIFDFYDNTPELQAFSYSRKGQPRVFDYVHDALQRGCRVRLFKGNERPTLASKGPKKFYRALFVEITREDLREVNTALMTVEGMAGLMGSVGEKGVLCYHISHRYHDFSRPLADAARKLGFACKLAKDSTFRALPKGPDERDEAHFSSAWFVVARRAADLDHLETRGDVEWSVPRALGKNLWRDGQPHDLDRIKWGPK